MSIIPRPKKEHNYELALETTYDLILLSLFLYASAPV